MTPMMSRPLPKALVKKRQEDKRPRKQQKKKSELFTMAMMGTAVLVGSVGAILLYAAFSTSVQTKPKKPFKDKEEEIAAMLEQGNSWYENEKLTRLKRAREMLDEAYAKGGKAGRVRQRTSLMVINLRTLIRPDKDKKTEDGKPVADVESGGIGNKRKAAQPRPTDSKGKLLPGELAPGDEVSAGDVFE